MTFANEFYPSFSFEIQTTFKIIKSLILVIDFKKKKASVQFLMLNQNTKFVIIGHTFPIFYRASLALNFT